MFKLISTVLAAVAVFGADLQLQYLSDVDGTMQPFRVYTPSRYTQGKKIPVVIVLHGTGGDQNSYLDDPYYQISDAIKAAENHNVLMVFPMGRQVTEYRGIGENDCFCVLEQVKRRWTVDEDRIYVTGLSMGGTGAAYLALHHPDLFAAAVPMSAAYSFPWIARNAEAVPFLWIGGAKDNDFYHRGVAPGVERMRQFGTKVTLEVLPGEGHQGPLKHFDRSIGWLLEYKRDPHPKKYYFEADTPLHGRAWWTTIKRMTEPGKMASIEAEAVDGHTVRITTRNVAAFDFHPDPAVFDLSAPIELIVDGRSQGKKTYQASEPADYCAEYRRTPVGDAPETLDMLGEEKPLANWIADAMRSATGADIALWNGWAYRGLPIFKGKVDVLDLVQASRPFDQYLVTAQLTGKQLLAILNANVPDPALDQPIRIDSPGASRLVQVSGIRYKYDRSRPRNGRVTWSTVDPERKYLVALEGQVVERETIFLAGLFKKLDYQTTDVPFTLALYGHAARNPRIEAKREGRVVEEKPGP